MAGFYRALCRGCHTLLIISLLGNLLLFITFKLGHGDLSLFLGQLVIDCRLRTDLIEVYRTLLSIFNYIGVSTCPSIVRSRRCWPVERSDLGHHVEPLNVNVAALVVLIPRVTLQLLRELRLVQRTHCLPLPSLLRQVYVHIGVQNLATTLLRVLNLAFCPLNPDLLPERALKIVDLVFATLFDYDQLLILACQQVESIGAEISQSLGVNRTCHGFGEFVRWRG